MFAILGMAGILFASGRVRLDVVALGVVLALMLTGVATPRQALAGFGDPVVLLVAGLLVVGEMLNRTGVAFATGRWLMRVGGSSETRMLVLLMGVAAGLGSVMSSTAVTAVFIPVVLTVTARTSLDASRLLMPLSFAALVSGMLTLIATTPNLVVSAELGSWDGTCFRAASRHRRRAPTAPSTTCGTGSDSRTRATPCACRRARARLGRACRTSSSAVATARA